MQIVEYLLVSLHDFDVTSGVVVLFAVVHASGSGLTSSKGGEHQRSS